MHPLLIVRDVGGMAEVPNKPRTPCDIPGDAHPLAEVSIRVAFAKGFSVTFSKSRLDKFSLDAAQVCPQTVTLITM